jgi:hypothetical protein
VILPIHYKDKSAIVKAMSNQQSVMELLLSLGFKDDGETHNKRRRLKLPRTKLHATIGEQTVCIYKKEGGEAYDWRRFPLNKLDTIRRFVLEEK